MIINACSSCYNCHTPSTWHQYKCYCHCHIHGVKTNHNSSKFPNNPSEIFENNAIFDIYRNKLDETETKYYYVLFVRVPTVIIVTVVVENEVKIQLQSKLRWQPKWESHSKLELKYKYKSKLQSTLQSNCNLSSLIWYHPFISQTKSKTKSKLQLQPQSKWQEK